MENIIDQIKSLAHDADEGSRRKILDGLRDLALSLETPQDTMQRISYLHLQPALVRVGLDLNIFKILAESDHPLNLDELAAKTNAAPTLLARVLRYLASVGTIKETADNTFTGNNITRSLSDEGIGSAIYHNVNIVAPPIFALPDFLAKNKYQDITSSVNTPLQQAFNTDKPAFVWAQTKPELFVHFNKFMEAEQRGMRRWFDVFPIEDKSKNLSPDQALFVDVGGNIGHQSVALKKRLPDIENDIIVEDMEIVIPNVIPFEGVITVVFDFFQPQVVKGARFYYFRSILHDWADEKALIILKNTISALGPDSAILIDEMVLPNSGVHWHATQVDMAMMSSLASLERTTEQWHTLLEKAGLRIVEIHTYSARYNSILECVPV
ncbi:hypothetical protein N7481_008837 [Penicillium waksmanii]|uniref:uncharacterized protein n=1 Tax=Penicillium waksmanii TaxID=69791 RepID=UPI00254903ED|nr:uncharacterized protein N7481_008837 [Penicillium waksmanii]KAJ5975130.1 hypothetical protein N7481_008837 [Penicillium waksmanii]